MTQLTDNGIFSIPMPKGSKKHHIGCTLKVATSTDQSIFYKGKDDDELDEWTIYDLPPGSYEFLFTTQSATEEDARKVVPVIYNHCPETLLDEIFAEVSVETHLETLNSLLRSKHLEGNQAIIKIK